MYVYVPVSRARLSVPDVVESALAAARGEGSLLAPSAGTGGGDAKCVEPGGRSPHKRGKVLLPHPVDAAFPMLVGRVFERITRTFGTGRHGRSTRSLGEV